MCLLPVLCSSNKLTEAGLFSLYRGRKKILYKDEIFYNNKINVITQDFCLQSQCKGNVKKVHYCLDCADPNIFTWNQILKSVCMSYLCIVMYLMSPCCSYRNKTKQCICCGIYCIINELNRTIILYSRVCCSETIRLLLFLCFSLSHAHGHTHSKDMLYLLVRVDAPSSGISAHNEGSLHTVCQCGQTLSSRLPLALTHAHARTHMHAH